MIEGGETRRGGRGGALGGGARPSARGTVYLEKRVLGERPGEQGGEVGPDWYFPCQRTKEKSLGGRDDCKTGKKREPWKEALSRQLCLLKR